MQDALEADEETTAVLFDILNRGVWGKVMSSAFDDGGKYGNDEGIIAMSMAIAEGQPTVREWFSMLADAMIAKVKTEETMRDIAEDTESDRWQGYEGYDPSD